MLATSTSEAASAGRGARALDVLVHAKGGRAGDDGLGPAHADDNVENVVGARAAADVLGRDLHEAGEGRADLALGGIGVHVVVDLGQWGQGWG